MRTWVLVLIPLEVGQVAPIRLRNERTSFLADSDLSAVFEEAVLDLGGNQQLRVDQVDVRDMDWCLLLDSLFETLVFFVVYLLEFQVDSTDCHHVALSMNGSNLAFRAFIGTRVNDYLVSQHYLPVGDRHLWWSVAEHAHGELS